MGVKPTESTNIRIALVVPLGWEFANLLTEGILHYQAENGGILLRDFRYYDPTFEIPDQPPKWDQWDPTGILCAIGTKTGFAQWLVTAGLPTVNMSVDVDPKLMPSVHASGGGKLAVDHLASFSIRHFAHIGLRDARASQLRYEHVSEAVQRHGGELLCYDLPTDPENAIEHQMQQAVADPELLRFLDTAPKPLGVVALNDDFARCVCLACRTLKLKIPDDVLVVGVDNTSAARFCDPPLTSVCPPGQTIGYEAMKLLHQIINGAVVPTSPLVFPCEDIEIRQSTQRFDDDVMDRAMRLIESEACRGLTVGELVRYLMISRSNLEKHFDQRFGTTPGQKIKEVKLEKAKNLLAETELSITRISGMLGYARSSVFSAFFRKCEGVTPSEYRDAALQQ